jgi:hypothetical protein
MSNNFVNLIVDYRERCALQLQEAKPSSAEENAYQQMLWVFDQDPEEPLGTRVLLISGKLMGLYRALSEPTILRIVKEWADNFIRDAGLDNGIVHF